MVPLLMALNVVAGSATPARAAGGSGDTLVNVGSPSSTFPLNKQNEPAVSVAIDPAHPNVVVSGSNDEIDNAPCAATSCAFTAGVTDNGVYFSFNGGQSYTQPTYTGWSARTGTAHVGPIGTVPGYFEKGLVGDGDPALAFGPRPGAHGFSWSNGSRLYYGSLASNFPNSTTINGAEAIAVARTDNVAAAAANHKGAWMAPVIASKDLAPITFSDKDAIWADTTKLQSDTAYQDTATKLIAASIRMADPSVAVDRVITMGRMLGSRCRPMSRPSDAPTAFAASTYWR